MPALVWDNAGEKLYETGIDHGVLYPTSGEGGSYTGGVAWNGISAVNERPSGAEPTPIHADNMKYLELTSAEDFNATLQAYMYPEEFTQCDGSKEIAPGVYAGQQRRTMFGLSYRTKVGNDQKNEDYGYKLHLVWNAKAAPSEKNFQTINDSPEAIQFSWELTTTPIPVTKPDFKPMAHMEIDSTKVDPEKLAAFEAILYGNSLEAKLPSPDEVITHFTAV